MKCFKRKKQLIECRNWWQTAVKIWRTVNGTAGEKCHGSTYGNSFHPPPALALLQKHTNFLPWNVRVWNISESISLFRFRQYLIRNTPATKTAPTRNCDCMSSSKIYKALSTTVNKTICDWRRSFGGQGNKKVPGHFLDTICSSGICKNKCLSNQKKYDKSMI